MSERKAASHFGTSRASVKKKMMFSVPPGYQRTAQIKRPKLDGFTGFIDQWMQDDLNRPRKQRHTAKRIFERLRDEHQLQGGYTTVKNYIREHGRRSREMFVPLAHAPGHAQADFGEAMVVIGGVEQKAYFSALDLPYSDACFVRVYPAAVSEAYVPLGYDVQDRKLLVNEAEAASVRRIFERFVELGSATLLAQELRGDGFRNKQGTLID